MHPHWRKEKQDMPKKTPSKHPHQGHPEGPHKLEGHLVEIREREGNEELWIDGERQKFFVTPDGYTLHADAYVRPQKTLLAAVENYLRTKPVIGGHEH
jgi:hypothetical protein